MALVAVLLLYGLVGLLLIAFLAPSTFPGADLAVYQRAGRDLLEFGDPYHSSADYPYVFQYRYPPLLAMLMPVLGWAPLWYTLLAATTMWTFLRGVQVSGSSYLLPVIVLGGAWGQVLVNGNVQPAVMACLAAVPLWRRGGAVALSLATMLKIHPVLGVLWYLARRDWQALRWFAVATAVLLLVQLPWLPAFFSFYLEEEVASPFGQVGFGLRAIHPLVWVAGTLLVLVLAWRGADSRFGWLLNICLQLAALPRVLRVNRALVLAAPIPARKPREAERPSTATAETAPAGGS